MASVPLEQWASTVVLGDGDTALIRPITPADRDELRAFHERQSPESRYRRYFSAKPTLTDTELDHFTIVDFRDRVALVAERRGELIGWASYERWANRDDAEAAFHVDDRHQGKGVATLLLEHLASIARTNGIHRFTAEVLADNRAMLSVFARAGWPLQRRFDSGVVDVDFELDDTAEFVDTVERREQRADSRAMARLLLPRSIAVVGASDRPGSVGRALWHNVARGFDGPVFPVNPAHDKVGGYVAYPSLRDVPGEVTLAVIAVPHEQLVTTIDDCIATRVRGAIVVTATDGVSIDLADLVARARRNGLRIIGPASMGIASPRSDVGIQASIVDVRLPEGGVAISLQSGTLGSSVLRLAGELQMGMSWFVSLGDRSDVSGNDLLQFWLDDEATTVVAMYTETLGNPRKFARIARHVAQRKPIVVVRTGAAMIGPGTGALYQQAGLIEVPTVVALLDTARVMATQPPLRGPRVAVLTNSRSPGVLARAAIRTAGLEPTDPPLELSWRSTDADYEQAVRAALDDDRIDGVLVMHAPPVASAVGGPVDEIDRAAHGASKPVVAVLLGALDGRMLPDSPVPAFAFPEPAAAVLGRVYSYWRWHQTEGAAVLDSPGGIDVEAATTIITAALDTGRIELDLGEIRALLAAYGVEMAPGRLVPFDGAVAAAAELGYPVAVKARHRHLGRSAQAGVGLDLGGPDEVAATVTVMREHLGSDADEVIVQRMVPPGVDMRLRVSTDHELGPVVTVGLGGAQADVIGDEVSRLAPTSTTSARTMLAATRAATVLDGDDEAALVEVIVRVAQLASDHAGILELDLNPVIVAHGRCVITDATARLTLTARAETPLRRLE
jgi:acyl-CoA synthetase (NDP forming)/RimJ/RimL family protein N-acetyltransferase